MNITHPTVDELEAALELAFGHLSPPERAARIAAILEQFHAGRIPLNGIFQAKEKGKRVGVLFSQPRTDGSILLWAPTVFQNHSPAVFYEPFERLCRQSGAAAVLGLADFRQSFDEKSLLQDGHFEYLSDLVYFMTNVEPIEPLGSESGQSIRFEPMTNRIDLQERLQNLVRATYRNARDFPRLMGFLPVERILEGYRQDGVFRPELWFFVRENKSPDRDVGVLLMTDYPEDQIELTYMGLIEEVRGRGLARQIVRFARQTARLQGRRILLTAADEQNTAAVKSYQAQGFQAWDRKKVYARFFT